MAMGRKAWSGRGGWQAEEWTAATAEEAATTAKEEAASRSGTAAQGAPTRKAEP